METGSKYLGIDYGSKRVGIAISDESKRYSFSRDFIINDRNFFEKLINLIREENIERIIIGYPLNFKTEKTIQTLNVEKFREDLELKLKKDNLQPEINFFDERFTSKIAQDSILRSGLSKSKRREKGRVDSISAQIILQDYLDRSGNTDKNNIYI